MGWGWGDDDGQLGEREHHGRRQARRAQRVGAVGLARGRCGRVVVGVVDEPGHRRLLSAGAAWAIIIVIVVVIIIVSVCACCFCCSDCPLHAPKRNRNAHAPPAAAAPVVVVASQSATDTAAAEKV